MLPRFAKRAKRQYGCVFRSRRRKKVKPKKYVKMPGKLVMVGFGSVGQGALPLLLRHLKIARSQVLVRSEERRVG